MIMSDACVTLFQTQAHMQDVKASAGHLVRIFIWFFKPFFSPFHACVCGSMFCCIVQVTVGSVFYVPPALRHLYGSKKMEKCVPFEMCFF